MRPLILALGWFVLVGGKMVGWSAIIRGQIIDAETQQPVPGCEVVLLPEGKGQVSDSAGIFVFYGVRPGCYRLQVQFIGYRTWCDTIIVSAVQEAYDLQIVLQPALYSMQEVLVVGREDERSLNEFASTYDLKGEAIWNQPGTFGDPQRALSSIPALVPVTDLYNAFSIRGGDPRENSFYINDFEVRNPNHFGLQGNSGGIISLISPLVLDKIVLYAGNQPLKYPNALSAIGVYHLRTEFPERLMVNANFSGVEAVLSLGKKNQPFQGFMSARKSLLQWVGQRVGLTTVPQYMDGIMFYHFTIAPGITAQFLVLGMNDKFQLNNGSQSSQYTRGVPRSQAKFKQLLAGISLKGVIGKRLFFRLTSYRNISRWQFAMFTPEKSQPYLANQSRETEQTLRWQLSYFPLPFIEITTGGHASWFAITHDLRWNKNRLIFIEPSSSESVQQEADVVRQNRFNEFRVQLFSECLIQFPHRFGIAAGIGSYYSRIFQQAMIFPRLAISLRLPQNVWLRVAAQENWQFPAFIRTTLLSPFSLPPVSAVKQFGVEFESKPQSNWHIKLESYWKFYQNIPFLNRFDNPGYRYAYSAAELLTAKQNARVVGGGVWVQYRQYRSLQWQLNVFTVRSQFSDWRKSGAYPGNFDLPFGIEFAISRQIVLNRFSWYQWLMRKQWFRLARWVLPIGDAITLSMRYRMNAGRPYTLPEYHVNEKQWVITTNQALNAHRYPLYQRLDIRVEKQLKTQQMALAVYFAINNLLDYPNVWDFQYLTDGRKIPVYQFQTVPFWGMRVQW